MLEEIVPILKNFRDRIYHFFPSRRDAAMELIDALSSNQRSSRKTLNELFEWLEHQLNHPKYEKMHLADKWATFR